MIKNIITKHKNIVKLICIFFIFFFVDYVQLLPIKLFNIKQFTGATYVLLSTFSSLVLMCILFFIYRKELQKEWDKFRTNMMDNIDVGLKYWFVGLIGMVVANLIITNIFKSTGAGNEQVVQQYITYLPWLMLINAGIIAPFNEEIVFRKAFKDAINNKWLFIILSGFVFGSMHVISNINNWTDILYIFPYGFLGSAFAKAYDETDTVFTPMSIHFIHNTILIITSIITSLAI